jgi:hypothetical protein
VTAAKHHRVKLLTSSALPLPQPTQPQPTREPKPRRPPNGPLPQIGEDTPSPLSLEGNGPPVDTPIIPDPPEAAAAVPSWATPPEALPPNEPKPIKAVAPRPDDRTIAAVDEFTAAITQARSRGRLSIRAAELIGEIETKLTALKQELRRDITMH